MFESRPEQSLRSSVNSVPRSKTAALDPRRDAMTYLLQYARLPDSIAPRRPAARVDEYAR